jgi:DNA-binding NtrC family response regulator
MLRALVVDDEKNIRLMLSQTLAVLPLQIDTAANGEEALQMVAQHDYAIVLVDLKMPGMDGIEVLRRVREVRPDIPVILLTAFGTIATAVEAMKLGAVDFVQKPFDSDQLRELVQRVLRRQELDEGAVPDYASHFELAKKCLSARHVDAALQHLKSAIALSPTRPEAFNMIGAICEMRRDIPEALKHYRAALQFDPTYAAARTNVDRLVVGHDRTGQILLGELVQGS